MVFGISGGGNESQNCGTISNGVVIKAATVEVKVTMNKYYK